MVSNKPKEENIQWFQNISYDVQENLLANKHTKALIQLPHYQLVANAMFIFKNKFFLRGFFSSTKIENNWEQVPPPTIEIASITIAPQIAMSSALEEKFILEDEDRWNLR